jgi:RHS repeat-associated protein
LPPTENTPIDEKPPEEIKKELTLEQMALISMSVGAPGNIMDINNARTGLAPDIDNTTGALVYKYPISVSPGRNNTTTPDVDLVYNSASSTTDSAVGSGWSINIPSIERINKKGTNTLYSDNFFSSSLDGELVSTGSGNYVAKVENGNFLKYSLASNVWTVTDKEGTVYKFGNTAGARQDNSADTSQVFKWMLEEVRDTNDNYISYTYYKDAGQIYPAQIVYTGNGSTAGVLEVNFDRTSRTSAPILFNTGFSVQSNYRITEIRTEVDNIWAHKYTLAYTTGANSSGSLLDTIVEAGQDDSSAITTLPAINFDYQTTTSPGWTYNLSLSMPFPFTKGSADSGARVADINGDGLPDLVCHSLTTTSGASYCPNDSPKVYLNDGIGGWTDVSSTWLFPYIPNSTDREAFLNDSLLDTGLRVIDLNGDNLPDLVRSNANTGTAVYINNGSGWTYNSSLSMPFPFTKGSADSGARVADINGDGLPDLVCHSLTTTSGASYCPNDSPKVYLNDGIGGWTDVSSTWLFPYIPNSTDREAFLNDSLLDTGLRVIDLNGDNLPDLVRSNANTGTAVYINNSDTLTNLLTKITYTKGGDTTIAYKATPLYKNGSNNLLNPALPLVVEAVSQITTNDGFGTASSYAYEYEGGLYYYSNYLDRKFAGFNSVKVTDAAGNVKKTYYYQGNSTNTSLGEYNDHVAKIGTPYRVEEYDNSNNLYRLTVDKVDRYNIGTDHDFAKVIRRTELYYDGNGGHKDISAEYAYDDSTGNVTTKTEWGEVTGSTDGSFTDTGSDKKVTLYSYATNGTTSVNVLYNETVTDQSAVKVKENKYYYDLQSYGSVTKGNQTKVEQWVASSTYINSQKTYDSTYGNIATSTDPRGKVTTYTTYDSYNLYPITITDPLSQTVQYTYDYSLGKPKQITDQNGFVYQTVYDGLDRVLAQKIPDFSSPYSAVTKTAYTYTDTSGAVKVQRTDNFDGSTSADTYQYFDGLGRLIQERKEAESNYNVKDTVYNNIGLVQKQSLPYNSSGSAKTSATGTTSLYATNTYDPLSRISTVVDATGTTSYAYDDWKTTVTDKNNKVKKYYKDAYNNLVKVDEVNGASTYTTNYEWNLNSKLTKITDALSNVRNFTYDGLGHKLTAEDLHASGDGTFGTWTYTYDDAGNLTQSVSPRSLTTNYTYNDINQQLTEDYTGVAGTEITYVYGGGCTNGIEKLCSVTMTSGANTVYTYDSNGNLVSEAKTINGTAYTTSYTYDRQGNKLIITYPDSAQVRYTFNTAGLLEKIERKESGGSFSDVVSNFDYSPADQIYTQTYANGVVTTNTNDAAHLYRLSNKQTAPSPVPPGNAIPIISLTGLTRYDLTVGDTWTEQGYSATDTEDGIITGSVTVTGSVNTAVAATYQLVYSVVDSYAVPATRKMRTVVVHTPASMTAKALIIAGGGGGGKGSTRQGGGGGAGGYQENSAVTVTAQAYTVTVGGGGAGATSSAANGQNGSNSSALGLTSTGGGGGASGSGVAGSTGGSGGGGAGGNTGNNGAGGIGSQNYNGGMGYSATSGNDRRGGGGGGAGGVGTSDINGGNGGAGVASSITGTSVTRAGGGGNKYGGSGGGGNGNFGGGVTSGATNTGGGGGGGGTTFGGNGGAGGSGIVVITYHTNGSDGISPSSTGGTITTSGGYTIHTFTSSGTFTAVASSNANPVISLTGSDRYDLNVNDTWTEPGFSATDTEDGTLTGSVTVTGSVNTAVGGTYQLVYSVADSQGAQATRKIRTVVVKTATSYLQNSSYTYDNMGNITQIVDASNTSSSKTANYVYDDLNRMTSATITSVAGGQSTYTHTFTYDAIGNIISGPIGSYTYAGTGNANPHAATTINSVTYSYDNGGNLTGNGTLSDTWNYKDQLTQAVAGGVTSNYLYDHAGERASLANGTTTTVYPNDYYNTDGTKQTKSIYAGDQLVATVETVSSVVTPYYIHGDHLGSTSATSNGSGSLVETLDYFPFGNQRISSGAHIEQRQYVGQIYDADTGLDYLNARYYEGSIGRFISQDPVFLNPESMGPEIFSGWLKNPQAQNSYSYANNNPITLSDPDGKIALIDDLAGFVGGGLVGTGVYALTSAFAGEDISWSGASGAFVTGGIIGWGAVNTPATLGASNAISAGIITGTIGGFYGNLTTQAIDVGTGKQSSINLTQANNNAAVTGITSGVLQKVLPNAKIPGLSSGRGNMSAIGQSMQTKLSNGSIKNISPGTATRSAIGSQAADLYKTVGGAVVDVFRSIKNKLNTKSKAK